MISVNRKPLGIKIAISQGKGGAGKSFFTVNLAVCFRAAGYKVLLVDADPQGTSADWNEDRDNRGLEAFDSIRMDPEDLFTELDEHSEKYDFTVMDTGGTLNDAICGINAANYVLIPIESAMEGVRSTKEFVPKIGKAANKLKTPAGIIYNRWAGTNFEKEMKEILEDEVWIKEKGNIFVFDSKISPSVKAKETYAQGKGLVETYPKENITKNFVRFFKELCEELNVNTRKNQRQRQVSSKPRQQKRGRKSQEGNTNL